MEQRVLRGRVLRVEPTPDGGRQVILDDSRTTVRVDLRFLPVGERWFAERIGQETEISFSVSQESTDLEALRRKAALWDQLLGYGEGDPWIAPLLQQYFDLGTVIDVLDGSAGPDDLSERYPEDPRFSVHGPGPFYGELFHVKGLQARLRVVMESSGLLDTCCAQVLAGEAGDG